MMLSFQKNVLYQEKMLLLSIIKILAYLKVILLITVKYCHQKLLQFHIINKEN